MAPLAGGLLFVVVSYDTKRKHFKENPGNVIAFIDGAKRTVYETRLVLLIIGQEAIFQAGDFIFNIQNAPLMREHIKPPAHSFLSSGSPTFGRLNLIPRALTRAFGRI